MSIEANNCGIASISAKDKGYRKLVRLGLRPDSSGVLLKDVVRLCPNCQAQTVYYDHLANKACLSCGLTLINGVLSEVVAA